MARRRKPQPVLLDGFDDCLLGVTHPRADEDGIPVAAYSADMIAARLRDREGMTNREARVFVADRLESNWLGAGSPRFVWAATVEDFGAKRDRPDPQQQG
jgi:hypothetical protein